MVQYRKFKLIYNAYEVKHIFKNIYNGYQFLQMMTE